MLKTEQAFPSTDAWFANIFDTQAASRGIARRGVLAITALVVALIPALSYANFILNHFYRHGAYFFDSGVFAGLIWRHDAWLTHSLMVPHGSFYADHVMPLLSILTLVSYYVPFHLPGWFALVTGVGHALPAVGVFWLLTEGLGLRSAYGLALSAVFAVAFAFSGIPLATIVYPHPEIILAGGLILACAAIALQRYRIAAAWLVFTLLVREDAGFHAFGILFLLVAANKIRHRPWREQRPLMLLALMAFVYSVGAVLFKPIVFPDQGAVFVIDYLGSPPFSNISLRLVLSRFFGMMIFRAYVFWPGVAALIWAAWSRNILIAVGYLAFCPWLLLNLLANRSIPGTLAGYYAFPFLVACAWPLAGVIIDARQRGVRPDLRTALLGFTVMLALSFVGLPKIWNPGELDLWSSFTTRPDHRQIQATDRAIDVLVNATASGEAGSVFGSVFMDQSVYSFAPYTFDAGTVVDLPENSLPPPAGPFDTIAYFESGIRIKSIQDMVANAHLAYRYRFTDTSILLASNKSLSGIANLHEVRAGSLEEK